MAVELLELEFRPCALVDGVGCVWSGGRWKVPETPAGGIFISLRRQAGK